LSFKDEGVCAVCEAIQSNKETKLASLNMGKNWIGSVGAKSVAAMAAVTGALTSLDISNNRMGDDGVKPICEALKQNSSLKVLDLNASKSNTSDGEIGPQGAQYLADMLSVNGGLTALDLSSNDLKDEGVSAVCKAIKSNKETKLASLNVKKNGIGSIGANAVAAMVAVTGALKQVLAFRSPLVCLFCYADH
jgi:Ran GTPase-activating protein (RanGAP) involved in mRNA processing and transport